MSKNEPIILLMKNLRRHAWLAMLLPLASCATKNSFVGRTAPEVTVTPVKPIGDVKLSSFRGKVVLLDFWATWCGPCKMLMPYLSEMQTKYGEKGFVVLGITGDSVGTAAQFKREHPEVEYDFYSDPKLAANKAFKVYQLPTTILIDRHGQVVQYDDSGFSAESAKDLEKRVAELVG
jgi:thiol-disulfide isomerase/thioredoxin